jgi:hypothetical protein
VEWSTVAFGKDDPDLKQGDGKQYYRTDDWTPVRRTWTAVVVHETLPFLARCQRLKRPGFDGGSVVRFYAAELASPKRR